MKQQVSSRRITTKKAIWIAFHILAFGLFFHFLETSNVRVTFLNYDGQLYAYWKDRLFIHSQPKTHSTSKKNSFSIKPTFFRGLNDLVEGLDSTRIIDWDEKEIIYEETSTQDILDNWAGSFFCNALGYFTPLKRTEIKLKKELPNRYILSLTYFHPRDMFFQFRTIKGVIVYKMRTIFREYKMAQSMPPRELSPQVPTSFYFEQIAFIFLFFIVIADTLMFIYHLAGWLLGKITRKKKTEPSPESALTLGAPKPFTSFTRLEWMEALIIFIGVFSLIYYYSYFLLDHVPRVVDEAGYLFQAKIFAAGHLSVPRPKYVEFLNFPGITLFNNPEKVYHVAGFPGHPLLLVPGLWLNMPWIIPPIEMGFAFVFIFLIGRYLFSRTIAWTAILLGLTSPWITVTGASFMAHAPSLFLGAMFIYYYIRYLNEDTLKSAVLAAVAMGAQMWVRPFTGFCLAVPFIGITLRHVIMKPSRWKTFIIIVLVTGIFVLGFMMYVHTQGYVGGVADAGQKSKVLKVNSLHITAYNFFKNLSELQYSLFGWSPYFTLVFFMLALLFLPKNNFRYALLLIFFSISMLYSWKGHFAWCYEPRYWYESLPAILLFTAAGIDQLGKTIARASGIKSMKIAAFVIPAGMVFLNMSPPELTPTLEKYRISGWFWRQYKRFDNYCYVNTRLRDWVLEKKPKNALIFVGGGPPIWRMTPIFPLMSLDFEGDVIFAIDKKSKAANKKMIDMYPDREVYWFDNNTVRPYSEFRENQNKRRGRKQRQQANKKKKQNNGKNTAKKGKKKATNNNKQGKKKAKSRAKKMTGKDATARKTRQSNTNQAKTNLSRGDGK